MKRRHILQTMPLALVNGFALTTLPRSATAQALATPDIPALLRTGGCAVMLRHAQTDPGIGDPPNFNIDQCSTQRNLSAEGKAQATAIGKWFASRKLVPGSVQTSAWCRCKDTAALAFGKFSVLPALGSTFEGRSDAAAQTQALRLRLASIAAGSFEVWVTHQVNVSALTGQGPAMGEAFVLRAARAGDAVQVLARTRFE
jgi:phosphohistidine phosphatase SixA